MKASVIAVIGILLSSAAFADKQGDEYYNNVDYAQSILQTSMNRSDFKNANGKTFDDHYTDHPDAQKYYNSPGSMTQDSATAIKKSGDATAVLDNYNNKPHVPINPNDPVYKDAKLYMDDAYNISHGISDRYVDCENGKQCHTEMIKHTCEKSNTATLQCAKVATPHAKKVPYQTTVNYSGNMSIHDRQHFSFTAPEAGIIRNIHVEYQYTPNNTFVCHSDYYGYINGKLISHYRNNGCSWQFYVLPFDNGNINLTVGANQTINTNFTGRLDRGMNRAYYRITMEVTRYRDEGYVTWSDVVCP